MTRFFCSHTTGYQTARVRRRGGAARDRAGVRDRSLPPLDDPWQDRAIPVRFHEHDASVDGDRRRGRAPTPVDGVIAVGDRPVVLAARAARGARAAVAFRRGRAAQHRQASLARGARGAPACRSPWFAVVPIADGTRRIARAGSDAAIPVRRQAARPVGQPRRDPRRRRRRVRRRVRRGCARCCARPEVRAARSRTRRRDPRRGLHRTAASSRSRACMTRRRAAACSRSSTSPIRSTARSSRRRST